MLINATSIFAQQERICTSHEYEVKLRGKYPSLGSKEIFEQRLEQLIQRKKISDLLRVQDESVFTIPVVFHVIHNNETVGSGANLSAELIQAQIDQLNYDFRREPGTTGFNSNPVGADSFIEFAPAFRDPDGNVLSELGINRIDRNEMGWTSPPYDGITSNYIDDTIKPESYWDPDQYLNIWVMDLSDGLLGYAQFPDLSGLDGLSSNGGIASTDGVVLLASSVGGEDMLNPDGGNFNMGRTATHEVGHWLGLRHIWGDAPGSQDGCNYDDYCDDTPNAEDSNGGCPTGIESCDSEDMIENYMDYTHDSCMNIFTQDQKTRMKTVLEVSPRRASLANSTVHLSPFPGVFISEVVDGNEEGSLPRYVEIHNASEEMHDLSGVSLRIYEDGDDQAFTSIALTSLTGFAAGDSYVISKTTFATEWGSAFTTATPDLVDVNLNGDGNDSYVLYDSETDFEFDIFGVIGVDGTGQEWEYTDRRVERKSYVLAANYGAFNFQNWDIQSYSTEDCNPGGHFAEQPSFDARITALSGIENTTYQECEGNLNLYPVVTIKNLGSSSFDEISFDVNDNGLINTYVADLTSPLAPGEVFSINLPQITANQTDEYFYELDIIDDGNPTNDNLQSVTYNVQVYQDATSLRVRLKTDDFPEELSWEIRDDLDKFR